MRPTTSGAGSNDSTYSKLLNRFGSLIERITGSEAVRALVDQTYHFHFILDTGRFGDHLAFCTRLASKIAVYRLRRPSSFGVGKELGSFICAHLKDAPT